MSTPSARRRKTLPVRESLSVACLFPGHVPAFPQAPSPALPTATETPAWRAKRAPRRMRACPACPYTVEPARFFFGILAAVLGVGIIALLGWKGFDVAEHFAKHEFRLVLVHAFFHGAVTLSLGYLAYTLIRVAERMLLPKSLLQGGNDPVATIRALLGVEPPAHALFRLTQGTVAKTLELLAEIKGKTEAHRASGEKASAEPPAPPPSASASRGQPA